MKKGILILLAVLLAAAVSAQDNRIVRTIQVKDSLKLKDKWYKTFADFGKYPLDSVTKLGNYSSRSIEVDSQIVIKNPDDLTSAYLSAGDGGLRVGDTYTNLGNYSFLNATMMGLNKSGAIGSLELQPGNNAASKLYFPRTNQAQGPKYIGLSVNGIFADFAGNISVPMTSGSGGGYNANDTLTQSVTVKGNNYLLMLDSMTLAHQDTARTTTGGGYGSITTFNKCFDNLVFDSTLSSTITNNPFNGIKLRSFSKLTNSVSQLQVDSNAISVTSDKKILFKSRDTTIISSDNGTQSQGVVLLRAGFDGNPESAYLKLTGEEGTLLKAGAVDIFSQDFFLRDYFNTSLKIAATQDGVFIGDNFMKKTQSSNIVDIDDNYKGSFFKYSTGTLGINVDITNTIGREITIFNARSSPMDVSAGNFKGTGVTSDTITIPVNGSITIISDNLGHYLTHKTF